MLVLAIAFIIIAGIIGSFLGYEMNLGPILSIATMGGFVLLEI